MLISTLPVIPRPALYRRFEKDSKTHTFLYLGCHTGWGKTTAVKGWLESRQLSNAYLSAGQPDFSDRLAELPDPSLRVIVIDDVHLFTEIQPIEQIIGLMGRIPSGCCLFLIGRSALPSWLKSCLITGRMVVYGYECLCFTREEAGALLSARQVKWDASLLEKAMLKTKGWPLGVSLLAARLQMNPVFDETLCCQLDLDVFDCFDMTLFICWEDDIRHFMLHMAAFDTFTGEMARFVTGKQDASGLLDRALQMGSFLTFNPPDTYVMHRLFHKYLVKKQQKYRSPEFIAQTYANAGLYYELKNDIPNALACYNKSGSCEKIMELLIENASRSMINGSFLDVAEYYLTLPREAVLESPELICAMAVLCSLRCQVKESEAWVEELEKFQAGVQKSDKRYSIATEALAYLRISLPHRGTRRMVQLIRDSAVLLGGSSMRLQEISVTGNCPSLLNGGKDFCAWVPHAMRLYRLMKAPIETVFGRSGAGLADIALGETLFEKNSSGDYTGILMYLNNGLAQADARGTLEMQFAAAGVMARIFAAKGCLDTAIALMDSYRQKAVKQNADKLIKNIRAFIIRQGLLCARNQEAKEWMEREAPDEMADFCTLERYRYMTKIRVYILMEQWPKAVLLLNRMCAYYASYQRHIGHAEAALMYAVVLKRMDEDSWRDMFEKVLIFCEKYGFIRLIADEGVAAYELLTAYQTGSHSSFFSQVLESARRQAILYPDYLKPVRKAMEPLTDTEKNVLRLLAGGKKNNEIAQLMGITLRTVKFHAANIYSKLCVQNRAQAMKAAEKLGL